jgi:chemotaxis response regulator CheB
MKLSRSGAPTGVVGIVASAGGIPALIELLRLLPSDFALPLVVAQHLPRAPSSLASILGWRATLQVRWAAELMQPQQGYVYLAPPGSGLTLDSKGFALSALPIQSSGWLPSGDRMIGSLVDLYGPRTVAIVLSGMLSAGVKGIRAVRACGGITMAQNSSAFCFDMPSAAIDFGKAEIVMAPATMAKALRVLADEWARA